MPDWIGFRLDFQVVTERLLEETAIEWKEARQEDNKMIKSVSIAEWFFISQPCRELRFIFETEYARYLQKHPRLLSAYTSLNGIGFRRENENFWKSQLDQHSKSSIINSRSAASYARKLKDKTFMVKLIYIIWA